jgi:hypothetical protein
MNNKTLSINAGVSIDNAIACIKRGDSELAIKFLDNAKELISYPFDEATEGVLNNFANADEQGLEFELDVDKVREFAHERDQFQL